MANGNLMASVWAGVLAGLLGTASPAAAAEDLPQTTDELWERLPSFEVKPGRNSDTPFCRRMLKDLKNHPEKFKRIPPKVETDNFEDPKLQEMLPNCSHKELVFHKLRDPNPHGHGGRVLEGIYRGENFAVWPLDAIDQEYPKGIALVWMGPSFSLEGDDDEYKVLHKRKKLDKNYDRYGSISGIRKENCELDSYFTQSISNFNKTNKKLRTMYIVKYSGYKYILDAYLNEGSKPYISARLLNKNTGRLESIFNNKYCSFFSE